MFKKVLLAGAVSLAATAGIAPGTAFATPEVVVTIKPFHSLVAGVMDGVAKPHLLLDRQASPHTVALKPSEAKSLQEADIVIWGGEDLETPLEKPIHSLAGKAHVIELLDSEGLIRLPARMGGTFERHSHGDDEHDEDHDDDHHEDDDHKDEHDHHADEDHKDDHADHDHDHDHHEHADHDDDHEDEHHHDHSMDAHFWLDPENAKIVVGHIADELAKADPDHAAQYRKNAASVSLRIDGLTKEIAADLAPARDKPFIVFHDAYQYFENRFGLQAAGSITLSPEIQPGAKRLREVQQKIKDTNTRCVFSEPQFEVKQVKTVSEGTQARIGELDPIGTSVPAGKDQYFKMMSNMAKSFSDCLGVSG